MEIRQLFIYEIHRKSTRIVTVAVALTAMFGMLPSCSHSDADPVIDYGTDYTIVNNTFSINAVRRIWDDVTSGTTYESFTANDRISIFAYTLLAGGEEDEYVVVVDNAINTYDGTAWHPQREMTWASPSDRHFFTAFSPELEGQGLDLSSIRCDVTEGPLMIASLNTKYTTKPLELQFSHLYGRLDVCIMVGSGYSGGDVTVTGISLKGKKDAVYDCYAKTLTQTDQDTVIELTKSSDINGVSYFNGVFLPGEYLSGSLAVAVTTDSGSDTLSPDVNITVSAGRITTVSLILGEHSVAVADVETGDWVEGDNGNGQIVQHD